MKFVATKTAEQLDLQALHRVRSRLVGQRTGIINQDLRSASAGAGRSQKAILRFGQADIRRNRSRMAT
jgi:hypothetical protein